MKKFIEQNPVLSYYLIVFVISWGGILMLVGGPAHVPGTKEQAEKLFVPALLIMFGGPFISGILMNFLIDGKEGVRRLLEKYLGWQTEVRWYAIAVFTGPILVAIVLFGLSLFNQDFLPGIVSENDKMGLVIFGVGWGWSVVGYWRKQAGPVLQYPNCESSIAFYLQDSSLVFFGAYGTF